MRNTNTPYDDGKDSSEFPAKEESPRSRMRGFGCERAAGRRLPYLGSMERATATAFDEAYIAAMSRFTTSAAGEPKEEAGSEIVAVGSTQAPALSDTRLDESVRAPVQGYNCCCSCCYSFFSCAERKEAPLSESLLQRAVVASVSGESAVRSSVSRRTHYSVSTESVVKDSAVAAPGFSPAKAYENDKVGVAPIPRADAVSEERDDDAHSRGSGVSVTCYSDYIRNHYAPRF